MQEDDWIACCTCCGWLGSNVDSLEGFDVCPECLSAVEWDRATGGADPDEDFDPMDFGDLPHTQARPYRHAYGRAVQVQAPSNNVVASKPRQGLLKACMAACREYGRVLRWGESQREREDGKALLRATGRVCHAPDEVSRDPAVRDEHNH